MMLEAAVLSMIVVLIRRIIIFVDENRKEYLFNKKSKKIRQYKNIKYWYLLVFAFVVQRMADISHVFGHSLGEIISKYYLYIHFVSYVIIIACLVSNLPSFWALMAMVGTFLNSAAIFANDGYMPVLYQVVVSVNKYSHVKPNDILDGRHIVSGDNTRLLFLSDIIRMPDWYPFPALFSVGDIFIAVAVFALIQIIFCDLSYSK